MKTNTTYSRLLSQLPEITEEIVKSFQNKLKKKEGAYLEPESWIWEYDWSQSIHVSSFAEVFKGIPAQKREEKPETVEEEVYGYFSRNELFVQIIAKSRRTKIIHKFPDFKEKDFFVPQEIVDHYKPEGFFKEVKKYNYPRTFIYQETKDESAIYESIVWGGLKDLKNNEIYILASKPNESSCFAYKPEGNILYAKDFISFGSELESEDFLKDKIVKIGKFQFETINPEEANKLFSKHKEWIEDSESTKDVLLEMLKDSKEFMMIGKEPKQNVVKKIPDNAKVIYITDEKVLNVNEKKKLKIK